MTGTLRNGERNGRPVNDAPITQRDLVNAVQGATLAVQVAELAKDVGELNRRMSTHEENHDREKVAADAQRQSSRRWRIGASIAALAAFSSLMAALLEVASRLH